MSEGPSDHPFVFVGGLQRSGTTLLGRLLAQHAQISGLVGTPTREDEGQFVQDVYLDDHTMGARPGVERGTVVRWAWHPEAHLTEADAAARPDAAARLLASWGPYWEKPAARWYVEKSPSNVMRTRFLQAVFPDSTFVMLVRHPVVQALAVRKWTPRRQFVGLGFEELIEHWLTAMECFRADCAALHRAVVWHYEDLVDEPVPFLTGVQQLIGVTPQPVDATGVTNRSSQYIRYWDRWRRGGRPGLVSPLHPVPGPSGLALGLAERGIAAVVGPRVARRVEERFGERIESWGYRLDDLAHRERATL